MGVHAEVLKLVPANSLIREFIGWLGLRLLGFAVEDEPILQDKHVHIVRIHSVQDSNREIVKFVSILFDYLLLDVLDLRSLIQIRRAVVAAAVSVNEPVDDGVCEGCSG